MATKVLSWCREIQWSDDPIVWIDVEKIEAAWRSEGSQYLGLDVRRWPSSGMPYRYKRFGNWVLKNRDPIKMPTACMDTGVLGFTDGRHRFAWCRDHGIKALPMTTSTYTLVEFASRFGTAIRKSELPIPIALSLNDKLLAKLREQ
jgi:hypothetical protein